MSWLARDNRGHAHRSRIAKGAVPLGQHAHKPDDVWPLTFAEPAMVGAEPPPRRMAPERDGVYPDLPAPAARALGCVRCPATAALVDPATGRAYCAAHWIEGVVQRQMG